eukprot:s755_g19.t1
MGTGNEEVRKAQSALRQILMGRSRSVVVKRWHLQPLSASAGAGRPLFSKMYSLEPLHVEGGLHLGPPPGLEKVSSLLESKVEEVEGLVQGNEDGMESASTRSPTEISMPASPSSQSPCVLELQAMLEDPVPFPSIGSAKHYIGLCKPCDFSCRSSCRFGYECAFCHICGPTQSRQWKKQKKSFWKKVRAAEAEASRLRLETTRAVIADWSSKASSKQTAGVTLSLQAALEFN